jgi:hypothetical protein
MGRIFIVRKILCNGDAAQAQPIEEAKLAALFPIRPPVFGLAVSLSKATHAPAKYSRIRNIILKYLLASKDVSQAFRMAQIMV